MQTHTRVLTLNRSIPINGNTSSVASRSPSERWASIRMQRIYHLRVCANTYTCNRTNHQWEHIMHRQSIPIGEVGIYKNAYIWVCVLTHTCVPTHAYTRVQLSCICDNKRQLKYYHQRKIGGRLVGRRSPRLGGGVRTSLLIQLVQS